MARQRAGQFEHAARRLTNKARRMRETNAATAAKN